MHKKSQKILIVRFSSIGDILLTTPFIRQVRTAFPNAHISYLVKKEFSDLIKYNFNINNVISFDSSLGYKGLKELSKRVTNENFDFVYDLHNNIRSNQVTKNLSQEKVFKISKDKFRRSLLIYVKLNFFDQIIMAPDKYLNVGITSGVKDNGEELELFWDGQTESSVEKKIKEYKIYRTRYLTLAPGAAHYTKMWPIEKSTELIKKILTETNLKVVLVGGPKERGLLSEFINENRVVSFFGKLSLLETASILKHSRGLITNDSGLMHMAVAVKKPLVAIFGSTTKELGFFPYRANEQIVENKELWCRPCTHMGRNYCPLAHFKCMNDISVEKVYSAVTNRLL